MDSITQEDFREDQLAKQVIDASLKVHKLMGPGLLEGIYEACLCRELSNRSIEYERQKSFPLFYEDEKLEYDLRVDFLVGGRVIIELKSVEKLLPVHEAQILTYMKLSGKRLGLLINFNMPLLKQGIKRVVLRNNLGDLGDLAVNES